MGLSETELVQRLLQERTRLLAYIWSIVGDAHMAEDVFQEVSLLAVSKRCEIEHAEAFPVWLRKGARLHALSALRRVGRAGTVLSNEVLDTLDAAWNDNQEDLTAAHADALRQCLQRLAPRSRQIVALRYHCKLSGNEVAGRLNTKVHSVYVALSRIHRTLRDCVRHALIEERNSYE